MGEYDDLMEFAKGLPDDVRPEPTDMTSPTATGLNPDDYEPAPAGLDRIGSAARAYRRNVNELNYARRGTQRASGFVPEQGLVHEDPVMDVATTMAGAGIGKAAGAGISKLGAPVIAKVVEPAVASGAASYFNHGGGRPTLGDIKATGVGAALGLLPAAVTAVKGAPAQMAERLPSAITQGAKTKAAKSVVMSGAAQDALDAHPDLKKLIATSTDPEARLGATNSKLNELTKPNDAAWEAIQKAHGGVPLQNVNDKLDALWEKARQESDVATMDAVQSYKKDLERLADARDGGPTLSAKQLRNVRNTLAAKIQRSAPGTPAFASEGAAVRNIKGALNEAAEDMAAKTPGVDVAAMKDRNKQIAQLLDLQDMFEEQKRNQVMGKFHSPLAQTIDAARHPAHAIAGLVDQGDAKLNAKLAMNQKLQDFVNGVSPDSTLLRGSKTPLGAINGIPRRVANLAAPTGIAGIGANALKPTPEQMSDREYTSRILQYLDANPGASMQAAVDDVRRQQK